MDPTTNDPAINPAIAPVDQAPINQPIDQPIDQPMGQTEVDATVVPTNVVDQVQAVVDTPMPSQPAEQAASMAETAPINLGGDSTPAEQSSAGATIAPTQAPSSPVMTDVANEVQSVDSVVDVNTPDFAQVAPVEMPPAAMPADLTANSGMQTTDVPGVELPEPISDALQADVSTDLGSVSTPIDDIPTSPEANQ